MRRNGINFSGHTINQREGGWRKTGSGVYSSLKRNAKSLHIEEGRYGILKRTDLFHHERSGLPALRILIAVSLLLTGFLLFPALSPAISLSGNSSTYAQSREAADGSKILRAYEYLDLAVQDIGGETISFHTGGWLRYDLEEEVSGEKSTNDIQYSYLSFKSKTNNTIVNLGRVMVFEGVAAERVDGLYARTDLKAGFGISAFGGSPVETTSDAPGNNVIYGGRLSHKLGSAYRIGVSALKAEKDGLDYRKEGSVDIWARPAAKVDLTGSSSYNDVTKGWMEHSYALMLGPFEKLRLNTTASWIAYDDYFHAAAMSAFTRAIQPNEKARILGEEASYPLTEKLFISAAYRNFSYDIAGKADYYGGKIRYAASGSGGAGLGYHRMKGETDRLQYSEYRVYGYKKLGRLDLSADVFDVVYAVPINGVKNSYSGSLAALYGLAEAWKIGADVNYSHNPDFDKDVRVFFKVLYRFGAKGGV